MEYGNGTKYFGWAEKARQKKHGGDLLLGAKTMERQNLSRIFLTIKIYRIVIEEHGTLHLIVDPGWVSQKTGVSYFQVFWFNDVGWNSQLDGSVNVEVWEPNIQSRIPVDNQVIFALWQVKADSRIVPFEPDCRL